VLGVRRGCVAHADLAAQAPQGPCRPPWTGPRDRERRSSRPPTISPLCSAPPPDATVLSFSAQFYATEAGRQHFAGAPRPVPTVPRTVTHTEDSLFHLSVRFACADQLTSIRYVSAQPVVCHARMLTPLLLCSASKRPATSTRSMPIWCALPICQSHKRRSLPPTRAFADLRQLRLQLCARSLRSTGTQCPTAPPRSRLLPCRHSPPSDDRVKNLRPRKNIRTAMNHGAWVLPAVRAHTASRSVHDALSAVRRDQHVRVRPEGAGRPRQGGRGALEAPPWRHKRRGLRRCSPPVALGAQECKYRM